VTYRVPVVSPQVAAEALTRPAPYRNSSFVTANAWLGTDSELAPGTEILRSERGFALWAYSAGRLLLRSAPDDGHDTTIDLLFTDVEAVRLRDRYDGLVVGVATADEAEQVGKPPGPRVFLLRSQDGTDYVTGAAVGWEEGVLDRTRPSFFSNADAYEPQWPTRPLQGGDAGFTIASATDLIEALGAGDDARPHRERYRMVYVLMTGRRHRSDDDPSGTGVFLSRADAEEACAAIAPHVTDCWIETLPVAI
jgi:hypothetical protein